MVYYFSGSLSDSMMERLRSFPNYTPIDVLVSQLDRGSITKMREYKKLGYINRLFIDSGAFSFHTGKAVLDLEEYIEFLNEIDDDVEVFAQVDTIPGVFKQPKSKQDYEESAKKSWENFLYMRTKVKSPHKLIPVFHFGEDMSVLQHMLEWKDENGQPLDYVGISPANDVAQKVKNIYLQDVSDIIKASSNPNIKTHLFGMTSLDALSKYPCYSADSVSHRLVCAYAKMLSYHFGVISVSKQVRTIVSKNNASFVDFADEYNLNLLKSELKELGLTIEDVQDNVSDRVAVTMYNTQRLLHDKYKYSSTNVVRPKKLF